MATKRIGRPRAPAIATIVGGTYPGTREIVETLVKESTHTPSWRPVRAGAAMGLAIENLGPDHVWMTAAEFEAWYSTYSKGKRGRIVHDIGMPVSRRNAILCGAPVSKVEALAIAHHRAGLEPPVEPGDVAAFSEWVEARFGAVRAITAALELSPPYLAERMRGYAVKAVGRAQRLPNLTTIRALDWVWRIGPFSPYGARLPVETFPGQLTETA